MPNDYPIHEIADAMQKQIARGAECHQKFTCASCGSRQTIDQPNVVFTQGLCEECGNLTNIEKQGCNYMFILPLGRNR